MPKKEVNENGLTPKEQLFVDYYIETLNATESCRRAGIGESVNTHRSYAYTLLKKPEIKAYITKCMDAKQSEIIASQDEVLEFLTSVMRNDYDKVRAMKPFLPKDRIACAELLGKRYALFTDKVEQTNEVRITVDIED